MKNSLKLIGVALPLLFSACGDGGSDQTPNFRLLKVGDSWTYTQTTNFVGGGYNLTYQHENKVTVVENPTDGTGTVHPGLAFKSEFTQLSGPTAPVGTEYELFTQDASSRDVELKGNITAKGEFLPKSGTIYLGAYEIGNTHEYDGDVDDHLITFAGTVVSKETVTALGKSLEAWNVALVETDEPNEDNFHDNGAQSTQIAPALGGRVDSTIEFDIGAPYNGRFKVTSSIKSTNVSL